MDKKLGQQEMIGRNQTFGLKKIRGGDAQQEMIGFVLIVVLVVVGLMVFLTISVRNSESEEIVSVSTANLLDSFMRHSTDCAIVFEPQYESFEDLFRSCHKNKECSNLGVSACDFLNESSREVLSEVMKSESTVSGYELQFFEKDGPGILNIVEGDCIESPRVSASQRNLISGSISLIVRLRVCNEA